MGLVILGMLCADCIAVEINTRLFLVDVARTSASELENLANFVSVPPTANCQRGEIEEK